MSFAYAGGTITQTGTDTSLAGLSGTTGVTHHNYGYIDIYVINSATELAINGTLTMNPETEMLVCQRTPGTNANAIIVNNNGVFNIGSIDTEGSYNRYPSGTAIQFDNTSTSNSFNYLETWANLKVEDGGTVNWYGGTIFSNGVIATMDNGGNGGGAINTFSDKCVLDARNHTASGDGPQWRQRSPATSVNGLVTVNFKVTAIANPTSFDNFQPIQSESAIDLSNTSPNNVWLTFNNFIAGSGNLKDVGIKDDGWIRLVNPQFGSTLTVAAQNDSTGTDQDGLVEMRTGVTLTVTTLAGSAISGVRIFCRDVNNGNRLSSNAVNSSPDYTADRTYEDTTNGSGVVAFTGDTGSVLLGTRHRAGNPPSGSTFSSRCKAGDDTDNFDFGFAGYGYLPGVQEYILKGAGGITPTYVLFADVGITEATAATVGAYTNLETGDKLYDRAQWWVQASSANMETAGLGNAIVTRSGTTISFGTYDLIIDSGYGSVFGVSGNNVSFDPGAGAFTTTTKWKGLEANTININSSSSVDGWLLTGTVDLNVAMDLSNVTVDGDLRIATGANSTLNFTNVTVTGSVFNDSGSNTLTINATNSTLTAGDAGTGNGQTNVVNTVPIKVTVKDAVTTAAIQGARVYLEAASGGPLASGTAIVNQLTDSNGEVNDTFNYSSDQPITGRVRKGTP